MVCDGVDLNWVTLCLSRQPEGGDSAEGVGRGRSFFWASRLPKEMGTVKKSLGLWQMVISFQNCLRWIIKELINFS